MWGGGGWERVFLFFFLQFKEAACHFCGRFFLRESHAEPLSDSPHTNTRTVRTTASRKRA